MRLPREWLREPLLYFLLAGAGLFLLAGLVDGSDVHRIVVTDGERARLSAQWQAQMGRPPTGNELDALTEQWIREEIYYREAVAMGLDQDDVIVRRRLAQKLTFLTEDLAAGAAPEETELRDYHAANAERYAAPESATFTHRYFSGERRDQAEADARAALTALREGREAEGDPFMLQRSYVDRSAREVGELFGREFAARVFALPTGDWTGPVRSAYGWHLVRIERKQPSRQLAFEDVAEQVAVDYRQQQRREANEAYYASLLARYEVIRP